MLPLTTSDRFVLIVQAAEHETKRLFPVERHKAQEIMGALDRLYSVLKAAHPYEFFPNYSGFFEKRKVKPLDANCLLTTEDMLNAEVFEWEEEDYPFTHAGMEFDGSRAGYKRNLSLLQALNIATNNLIPGNWGPWWGKTRALINVEHRLKFPILAPTIDPVISEFESIPFISITVHDLRVAHSEVKNGIKALVENLLESKTVLKIRDLNLCFASHLWKQSAYAKKHVRIIHRFTHIVIEYPYCSPETLVAKHSQVQIMKQLQVHMKLLQKQFFNHESDAWDKEPDFDLTYQRLYRHS